MAAVVNFALRDATTSGLWSTLTGSIRFRNADSNDQTATVDPLVRPSSGTNYSYWKNLRCRVTTNPATALLNLRVKCSVSSITIGSGSASGCTLYYAFRTPTDVPTNTAAVLSGAVGQLTTTEVDWVWGRTAGATSGGSVVANHLSTDPANGFWADGESDQLLLCMYVASSPASGGSLDAFNVILIYSEI